MAQAPAASAPAAPPAAAAPQPASPKSLEAKTAMCYGCHNIVGYQASFPEGYKVPRLGGQSAGYIAAALKAQHRVEIDRHKIDLKEPIKALGEHQVPLKLHRDVDAHVNVIVTQDR